jgi:hypothetical protein
MRLFSLAVISLARAPVSAAGVMDKRLIEFGWEEPGTEFIREHVGEMETAPLDGRVFHVDHRGPGGNRFQRLIHRDFEEAEATGHGRIVQRQLTRHFAGHLLSYGGPFPAKPTTEIDDVEFPLD